MQKQESSFKSVVAKRYSNFKEDKNTSYNNIPKVIAKEDIFT